MCILNCVWGGGGGGGGGGGIFMGILATICFDCVLLFVILSWKFVLVFNVVCGILLYYNYARCQVILGILMWRAVFLVRF